MPARPCARSVTVRDFVQAQGFLSEQPNLESSTTFTFSAAVKKSLRFLRYRFKVFLSSAAVKKSLRFLRYRFQVFISSAAVKKSIERRGVVRVILFFPQDTATMELHP